MAVLDLPAAGARKSISLQIALRLFPALGEA